MQTIREHLSRIKNNFKLTSQDTVITNRFIYLLMKKHRDFTVKRDNLSKLLYQDNLFQKKNFVELVDVDSVEACQVQSKCLIKRTKDKIPTLIENSYGVIIRWVGSIDHLEEIKPITSSAFQRKLRKKTSKLNKEKYYWYSNGYLYFPNVEWDAVIVDGYFEDELEDECNTSSDSSTNTCVSKLDQEFKIPDYLVSSMDQMIYQDLAMHVQIMNDEALNDNENLK